MSGGVMSTMEEMHEPDADSPFICEFGTVVEVDPATLAIKAIIPSISVHHVHNVWIRQMVPWVGTPGYGPVYAPAIDSEVLITGMYGQEFSLYYTCVFNETHHLPPEFDDGARGARFETPLKFLADLYIDLISQQRIRIEGIDLAEVVGASVKLLCGGSEVLKGEADKIAVLGNAPIAKRTLPAPGPTDTALTIAIRQLLIDFGIAQ